MIKIDKGKCRGDSGTRPVFWKRLPREIAGPAVGRDESAGEPIKQRPPLHPQSPLALTSWC